MLVFVIFVKDREFSEKLAGEVDTISLSIRVAIVFVIVVPRV